MPDPDIDKLLAEHERSVGGHSATAPVDAPDDIDALLAKHEESLKAPPVTYANTDEGARTPPPDERPWYQKLLHPELDAETRANAGNLAASIKEGASDALTAVKPYFSGAGGMAPDPVQLANDRKAAVDATERSPVSSIAAKVGLGALGGNVLAGAGIGNIASGGTIAGLDAQAEGASPEQTGLAAIFGAAVPAAAEGVGAAASKFGNKLGDVAAKLRTHIFMTPGQRSAFENVHGGEALTNLSKEAKDAGLYKAPWYKPLTARTVADNADALRESSGSKIGQLENEFTGTGANPDVPIAPITQGLRDRAASTANLIDVNAPADARAFTRQANQLEQPATADVTRVAPPPLPTAAPQPTGFETNSGADIMTPAAPPPSAPAPAQATLSRESLPLDQAIANKRDIAARINWNKNPNAPRTTFGAEQARKQTWGGTKDAIISTLKQQAEEGAIEPAKVSQYIQANKDFSTAATVFDPAMKMAERNAQGVSARDLALGTAMSGHGGLTMLAGKSAAGALPATEARTAAIAGGIFRGAGAAAKGVANRPGTVGSLIGQATAALGADATPSDIKRDANAKLKKMFLPAPPSPEEDKSGNMEEQ